MSSKRIPKRSTWSTKLNSEEDAVVVMIGRQKWLLMVKKSEGGGGYHRSSFWLKRDLDFGKGRRKPWVF